MKNRGLGVGTLLCLFSSAALSWAQASAPGAGKIGVINMQAAIGNTGEGKKAFGELEKKYEPRKQELQRQQQEIQALTDQLQKQGNTLSDDEQRRLSRELEEKKKLFNRATEDADSDYRGEYQEVIGRIGQKMVALVREYAQQNGYSLVLEAGPQMPIYYVSPQVDLTEETIKRYDAAHPVESGSGPAPASPAPRSPRSPATPKPGDKPKP